MRGTAAGGAPSAGPRAPRAHQAAAPCTRPPRPEAYFEGDRKLQTDRSTITINQQPIFFLRWNIKTLNDPSSDILCICIKTD